MNHKNLTQICRKTTVSVLMLLLLQFAAMAQKVTVNPSTARVAPVKNPCPRYTAGSAIQTPTLLTSSKGVLNVSFSYQSVQDSHGRFLFCFMTPNGVENPTLQVNPGDLLTITVTNNNSNPQGGMQMSLNPPNCGGPTDATMYPTSLNIHYHGTNTSPTCGSDEVIKTIINTGETFQYNVQFPTNEPPGLYWYHPHVHGNAEQALLGGSSGAIIVTGIENVQPAVSGLPQQILVIRDQAQVQGIGESTGPCTSNNIPFQDITVNNVPVDSNVDQNNNVTFTPAVLYYEREDNGQQFWRVTNSSADTILDLQLNYDGVAQNLQIVGIDGVPVNSQDGTGIGQMINVTDFRLPPASRVEFIVNLPSKSVNLAQLITNHIDTGANGDCDPTRPIFTLLKGDDASRTSVPKFSHYDTSGQRFRGLGNAPIAAYRTVYFDENLTTTPNQFYMVVQGQQEQVFNANAAPAIVAQQGTVEQWTVENHAQENHEFHFHQVHFQVQSENNFTLNGHSAPPPVLNQYLDMIEVPGWDGNPNHAYPNVVLLIDYRGSDTGNFVFHCHILNHEDLGMMNIIQVVNGSAKKVEPGPNLATKDKAPAHDKMPDMPSAPAAALPASGTRGGSK